ncbi:MULTISPECIES: helix-turn-helix domain-containing protein [unclassified Bradyrhizobium]|uniref:helix-turn-helix domain-containing protein n=1 Tax=unclassified Bradyrhizobium TaxID=2631580 RepID=UPI001BAE430B|nr:MULTISPECIES: helix-turn-helix domain-containing protein [unclassified Bradyrhizobium]WLA52358.1 helix-turn-helix domain-containing protein [Bradyrhizobium elkanii]MBR1206976.1 helix-turn-helix domain-containing protein [Bradyrhizobium sp. AUGA SZCCT0124]MBR1313515.1 helix-turn-helix domain-containing protein [Bradyrhizobium sp. AUGA SZCCT0051]MBR1343388.1 helix-turn-helix domain-containing protein [Bradyrhizobium sp. AUGA SZCCT0105]MBR1357192.1 helix-turn-helix domain-containing protein [B
MTTAKRRARRIAADEAHSWARHLRLRNPSAKDVLKNLTLYVDGEGYCWVGIPSLAEDLEMSPDTIRRRLTWLEMVGAISRQPQWVDEYGVRNGEQRGRRTTDKIRLLFEADVDAIEARAAGEIVEAETDTISTASDPSKLLGSNSQGDPPSGPPSDTRSGLVRPSHCGEGLISEPEPDPEPETPKAPDGGGGAIAPSAREIEPEHFAEAWKSYPGHEVMRRDLALEEFRKLGEVQRRLCRAAIPHFVRMKVHLKQDKFPNFHIWIRTGGFNEFPTAMLEETSSPTAQTSTSYDVAGREGRALKALHGLARTSLFEARGRVNYSLPMTARVLAFAELPPENAWQWVDAPGQLAAWSAFLSAHIAVRRPELASVRTIDGAPRRGFMAPWPWPPRKDGTIASPSSDDAGESE